MTHSRRGALAWSALAAALIVASPSRAEDFDFMPKGGRALLAGLLKEGMPPGELEAKRSESEWRKFADARGKQLSERERATLAAYLAVNFPAAEPKKLPRDGRDIAWWDCQSCHSLFSGYLTQSRDAQAWRNIFLSPFHRQMKTTTQEREEFARYSELNMPLKVEDVPPDLRY